MTAEVRSTVLLVDDDAGMQDIVTEALEEDGYRVLRASDWPGIACALVHQPALILLDIRMPHLDAVEVCQRLTARLATRQILIIACTALDRQQIHGGLLVDDWLAKPFDLDALYACVARWSHGRAEKCQV